VTPVSHAFSGGNVVFGTSPGRRGQKLPTAIGDIPVYNNVREGLDAGHSFNTGVVYLPPSGVRDGCESACKKDPAVGVIGIQSGPRDRGPTLASMILGS
jgi:succinyl-CoA synthetase alpha subunit